MNVAQECCSEWDGLCHSMISPNILKSKILIIVVGSLCTRVCVLSTECTPQNWFYCINLMKIKRKFLNDFLSETGLYCTKLQGIQGCWRVIVLVVRIETKHYFLLGTILSLSTLIISAFFVGAPRISKQNKT